GEVRNGVEPRRHVGRAEPGMFRRDHVATRHEVVHDREPLAGVARAVQVEQRPAGAGAAQRHAAAADRDLRDWGPGHAVGPRSNAALILQWRRGRAKGIVRSWLIGSTLTL